MSPSEARVKIESLVLSELARSYGFSILEKRTSAKWWAAYVVSLMFIWNRKFMTRFWTTDGTVVYVPNMAGMKDEHRALGTYIILRHELVHVRDYRAMKLKYTDPIGALLWRVLYLSPQLFALGAFGAFWSPWCWLFLIALGPWPAPFRVWAEKRGYAETIRVAVEVHGKDAVSYEVLDGIVDNFTGWAYWRMSWRRQPVFEYLLAAREETDDV